MIPVGVIRKCTEEGMLFLRFEFDFEPYRPTHDNLPDGYGECHPQIHHLQEDDPRKIDWDQALSPFNGGYSNPEEVYVYDKEDIEKGDEVVAWAFLVGDENVVGQMEMLKNIQLGAQDGDLTDTLAYLSEIVKLKKDDRIIIWDAFNRLIGDCFRQNVPHLIPYGESEFSVRGIKVD